MTFQAEITVEPNQKKNSKEELKILKKIEAANINCVSNLTLSHHFSIDIKANSKNMAVAYTEEICDILQHNEDKIVKYTVKEI